jgi:hypothetical protein
MRERKRGISMRGKRGKMAFDRATADKELLFFAPLNGEIFSGY